MVLKFLTKIEISNKGKFFCWLIWEENEKPRANNIQLLLELLELQFNGTMKQLNYPSSTLTTWMNFKWLKKRTVQWNLHSIIHLIQRKLYIYFYILYFFFSFFSPLFFFYTKTKLLGENTSHIIKSFPASILVKITVAINFIRKQSFTVHSTESGQSGVQLFTLEFQFWYLEEKTEMRRENTNNLGSVVGMPLCPH